MDHTEIIAASNSRWLVWTLQYQASARDSHLSFIFSRNRVFFNILLSTSTFPSAFFKKINKCIPLCFILYLLTSYVFICSYCFNILKQPERTLSSYVWPGWLYGFLAKSEGLVFPLPYSKAGVQVWHFGYSIRRPNPESQLCTQGWGEWCGPFSLSQTVNPNHHLLA